MPKRQRTAAGLQPAAVEEIKRIRAEWAALKESNLLEPSSNSNPNTNEESHAKKEATPAAVVSEVLCGVVALVEVGTEHRALPLRAALTALGATVVPLWSLLVTHVIWSEGGDREARAAARASAAHVVSPLWVEACASSNRRKPEKTYPAAPRPSDVPSPLTLLNLLKKADHDNCTLTSNNMELNNNYNDEPCENDRSRMRFYKPAATVTSRDFDSDDDSDDEIREATDRNVDIWRAKYAGSSQDKEAGTSRDVACTSHEGVIETPQDMVTSTSQENEMPTEEHANTSGGHKRHSEIAADPNLPDDDAGVNKRPRRALPKSLSDAGGIAGFGPIHLERSPSSLLQEHERKPPPRRLPKHFDLDDLTDNPLHDVLESLVPSVKPEPFSDSDLESPVYIVEEEPKKRRFKKHKSNAMDRAERAARRLAMPGLNRLDRALPGTSTQGSAVPGTSRDEPCSSTDIDEPRSEPRRAVARRGAHRRVAVPGGVMAGLAVPGRVLPRRSVSRSSPRNNSTRVPRHDNNSARNPSRRVAASSRGHPSRANRPATPATSSQHFQPSQDTVYTFDGVVRIVLTGMARDERRRAFNAVSRINGAKVQRGVNSRTTHVCVGHFGIREVEGVGRPTNRRRHLPSPLITFDPDPDSASEESVRPGERTMRTLNTLMGAVRGCRVVFSEWLFESIKAKCWLAYRPYVVPELKDIAEKAFVERHACDMMHREYAYNIFYGRRVRISSSTESRESAEHLLALCGAVVIDENGLITHNADLDNYINPPVIVQAVDGRPLPNAPHVQNPVPVVPNVRYPVPNPSHIRNPLPGRLAGMRLNGRLSRTPVINGRYMHGGGPLNPPPNEERVRPPAAPNGSFGPGGPSLRSVDRQDVPRPEPRPVNNEGRLVWRGRARANTPEVTLGTRHGQVSSKWVFDCVSHGRMLGVRKYTAVSAG